MKRISNIRLIINFFTKKWVLKDKPAAVSAAYEIRQSLEQGELLVTYNLGHTRILKSNFITNRILEFIKNE